MKAAPEGVAMQARSQPGLPQILAQWLLNNPKPVDADTAIRHAILKRTAVDGDMPRAWLELEKRGIDLLWFITLVESAYKNARREVSRQPSGEVDREIATVRRLIAELKVAIERSPLPAKRCAPRELNCSGLPSVEILMGWRDIETQGDFWRMHTLSVFDMLDVASELVEEFENSQPPRAVLRHATRPEVTAFVRWLGFRIRQEFQCELPGTLARIANAIYRLQNPLDKQSVKDILRGTPAPFLNKKGGRKAATKPP